MNPVEQIEQRVRASLPDAWARVRMPRQATGTWWLDVKLGDHSVSIEWRPEQGIGVSASLFGDGYGEGPDETFDDTERAARRVIQLLRTRSHSVAPAKVVLAELRARLGITQKEIAHRLGVQQAAVSRLERREDISLGSLQRFVAALGAELEINVRIPSGESIRLSPPDATPLRKPLASRRRPPVHRSR